MSWEAALAFVLGAEGGARPLDTEMREAARARLEALSEPEPMSGCRLFLGAVNRHGYGVFWFDGHNEQAQRAAYQIYNGVLLPRGTRANRTRAHVLHKCDIRLCIAEEHLWLGTPLENTADMIAKGRRAILVPPIMRGEENPAARYSRDVIAAVLASPLSHVAAAEAFGVGYHTVWKARRGLQWRPT